MRNLFNKKYIIYFIRLLGWMMLCISLYIGFLYVKNERMNLLIYWFFFCAILIRQYKIDYKKMTIKKKICYIIIDVVLIVLCVYAMFQLAQL